MTSSERFELWVRRPGAAKHEYFQRDLTADEVRAWTRYLAPADYIVYSQWTGGDVSHNF